MTKESDYIIQNIRRILTTAPGERINYPEFGCDLSILLFSPLNEQAIRLAEERIIIALKKFSPEISVITVAVNSETAGDGFIIIDIIFVIRFSQKIYQFAHTFRLIPTSSSNSYI